MKKKKVMKNLNQLWTSFGVLALSSTFCLAQENSAANTGVLEAEISKEAVGSQWKPVSANVSISRESNPDSILEAKTSDIAYADATFMSFGLSSQYENQAWTYAPSLNVKLLQENHYRTNQDIIKNLNFSNKLSYKAFADESTTVSPFASVNLVKRYLYLSDHRRKLDTLQSFVGLDLEQKMMENWVTSASISAGYIDHQGNYSHQGNTKRLNERGREEDRYVGRFNLTNVIKPTTTTTISMPLSYEYADFKERLARVKQADNDILRHQALTGAPLNEVTIEQQTASAGLEIQQDVFGVMTTAGYTYTNIKEKNPGDNTRGTDLDTYNLGLSKDFSLVKVALNYTNMLFVYPHYIEVGERERDYSYSLSMEVPNVAKDTSLSFGLSRNAYRLIDNNDLFLNSDNEQIQSAEIANNDIVQLGVNTTF